MKKAKVIMYAQFGMNVEQDEIDYIKAKMDDFLEMIEAELVGQKWEIQRFGVPHLTEPGGT